MIFCSIHGFTEKALEKYQIGSNRDIMFSNLKLLIETKKSRNSKTPFVIWRFLVHKYNEGEIQIAKAFAKEIGVDYFQLIPICKIKEDELLTREKDYEQIKVWLPNNPKYSSYDYTKKVRKSIQVGSDCRMLWDTLSVHIDGSVYPCCWTFNDKWKFGNILEEGKEVWNNENFRLARKVVRSSGKEKSGTICDICVLNNLDKRTINSKSG
jgi:radical SAM protein with 4Fe4S-binding SPASM domain